MGRKKIAIARITDERNRQVIYSTRIHSYCECRVIQLPNVYSCPVCRVCICELMTSLSIRPLFPHSLCFDHHTLLCSFPFSLCLCLTLRTFYSVQLPLLFLVSLPTYTLLLARNPSIKFPLSFLSLQITVFTLFPVSLSPLLLVLQWNLR